MVSPASLGYSKMSLFLSEKYLLLKKLLISLYLLVGLRGTNCPLIPELVVPFGYGVASAHHRFHKYLLGSHSSSLAHGLAPPTCVPIGVEEHGHRLAYVGHPLV